MSLIDPPQYVSLAPVLIYGCDDLEREHYKALLQVFGWMWVTKRHGRDLVVTTTELMERWGVAERTVYYRLQRFGELGYLRVRVVRGRCYVSPGPRVEGRQESGASCLHGASSLQGPIINGGGGCDLGVDSDLDLDQELHTTTINEEMAKHLRMRGIHPEKAEALAGDEWVTEERVERWWIDLRRQERECPGRVRSISAVLAANLEAHYEPPGLRVYERRRR